MPYFKPSSSWWLRLPDVSEWLRERVSCADVRTSGGICWGMRLKTRSTCNLAPKHPLCSDTGPQPTRKPAWCLRPHQWQAPLPTPTQHLQTQNFDCRSPTPSLSTLVSAMLIPSRPFCSCLSFWLSNEAVSMTAQQFFLYVGSSPKSH